MSRESDPDDMSGFPAYGLRKHSLAGRLLGISWHELALADHADLAWRLPQSGLQPHGGLLRMDPVFIRELFAPFRPVAPKRMFGGIGLYADGLMFGLVFDGVIYLRADDASIPSFQREGSTPFVYPLAKHHIGRPSRHFWRLPERLYDDPDELAVWAARALVVAEHRKAAPRTKKKSA